MNQMNFPVEFMVGDSLHDVQQKNAQTIFPSGIVLITL